MADVFKFIIDVVEKGSKFMIIIGSIIIAAWFFTDYANFPTAPAIASALFVGAAVAILHDPIQKIIFRSDTMLESTLSEFYSYTNLKIAEAKRDYINQSLDKKAYIEKIRQFTDSKIKIINSLSISSDRKDDALRKITEQLDYVESTINSAGTEHGWMGS